MSFYFNKNFYKFTALCSVVTGATTFLLWALPFGYRSEQEFPHINGFYLVRLWINFFHVFLALFAYFGVAATKSGTKEFGFFGLGFLCFLIWGITELIGVSVLLFAVSFSWRAKLAVTSDPAIKTLISKDKIDA